MPSLLQPADSFNSSSATIMPDRDSDRTRQQLPHADTTMASALTAQDSVGREFESLVAGRAGLLQSDTAVGDATLLDRYLREYTRMPNENVEQAPTSDSALGPQPSEFNPLSYLIDPTGTDSDFFTQLQAQLDTSSSPYPQPIDDAFNYQPSSPLSSAHSHRSHKSRLSLSSTDIDDSFSTTDMDTDDPDYGHPSPSPLIELGGLNLNAAVAMQWTSFDSVRPTIEGSILAPEGTISPEAEGLGGPSSRRTVAPSATRRGVRGVEADNEDKRRADRLEHRRSINRRSAQKHRLRRKEELETLTHQIAERDSRIASLEKELAVIKAQHAQLVQIVKAGMQQVKASGSS